MLKSFSRSFSLALGIAVFTSIAGSDRAARAEAHEVHTATATERTSYPWLAIDADVRPLEAVFAAPEGFTRVASPAGSFASWLRRLPLKPAGAAVRAFDGKVLHDGSDDRIAAVSTLDVPPVDLQQCADSVIRLHAEWLWSTGRASEARYAFTSGDVASFASFAAGGRPQVDGRHVRLVPSVKPDASHDAFERFLSMVMQYAGTVSLGAYSPKVERADLRPGDFFVLPGGPGHAVLVLDVAEHGGSRVALLGQGYMPAQDFQVLESEHGPWFSLDGEGVATPFWSAPFPWKSLRRLAP